MIPIEALSKEYRTVAVDQMGESSKSSCTKPVRSLQDIIAWLVLLAAATTVLRPPAEFRVRLIAVAIARQRGLRAFFRWIFADMARKDPQWIESTIEQLALSMRSLQRHKTPIPPVLSDAQTAMVNQRILRFLNEGRVETKPRCAWAG